MARRLTYPLHSITWGISEQQEANHKIVQDVTFYVFPHLWASGIIFLSHPLCGGIRLSELVCQTGKSMLDRYFRDERN